MFKNIKKSLKKDLWDIIDNKEVTERDIDKFIFFIFYLFLEKQEFLMQDVVDISEELKEKYEEILNESKSMALEGEPIKALKNIDENFCDKIKPIIEKIRNA